MSEVKEAIGDHWSDDRFSRKTYANFLTRYLRGKVVGAGVSAQLKPFTMALDAKWGSGKTFFLTRWSDDLRAPPEEEPRHTVVTFDAWAADYAADPLIAFMSELRAELQRAVCQAGLGSSAKQKATVALNMATRSIRKLAMSAAGVVAKGVAKQILGVDLAEVSTLVGLQSATQTATPGTAATTATGETVTLGDYIPQKQTDAVLDLLFQAQMSEHAKRKQSIQDFKTELSVVLQVLANRPGYSAPLFIMVDELDRCKPSFAVGLLEAVKHIFGVPGVCVLIATNVEQLAHTVKAVYGEGFDARTYLQRFFDAIYALPEATGPKLLAALLEDRPIFSSPRCKWASPPSGYEEDSYGSGKPGVLAWIFHGLQLDLRSQAQVLELMEAAAHGISETKQIHVAWLAIVCGLWHSHRPLFNQIEVSAKGKQAGGEVWSHLGVDALHRYYSSYSGEGERSSVALREIAATYCLKAAEDLWQMQSRYDRQRRGIPNQIERELLSDCPSFHNPGTIHPTGLLDYFALVRTAGHFNLAGSRMA